jgi:hypothetical protein
MAASDIQEGPSAVAGGVFLDGFSAIESRSSRISGESKSLKGCSVVRTNPDVGVTTFMILVTIPTWVPFHTRWDQRVLWTFNRVSYTKLE